MPHNPKMKKWGDNYYHYFISCKAGETRSHIRDSQRPDGSYLMILKGDVSPKTAEQPMPRRVQGLASSATASGPFTILPTPAISDIDTEDTSIWHDRQRQPYYAIFHAHHYIGLITSTDGTHWTKAEDYKITKKSFQASDNKTITVGSIERPSLYIENGVAKALCLTARRKGNNHGRCLIIPLE